MVIVKSKLTGKFLRHHSGSANAFSRNIGWKVSKDEEFLADLPEHPEGYNPYTNSSPKSERARAISREIHNRMYDADALEARRYATPGSALSSVGKWNGKSHIGRNRVGRNERVHTLPAYLEIHEIVAGNLCIVDVNDDEETKRRKAEDCK